MWVHFDVNAVGLSLSKVGAPRLLIRLFETKRMGFSLFVMMEIDLPWYICVYLEYSNIIRLESESLLIF